MESGLEGGIVGTELEVGYADPASNDDGPGLLFALALGVTVDGGGNAPPERKEGHKDLSSGRDVPPLDVGDKCDRIAAAYNRVK